MAAVHWRMKGVGSGLRRPCPGGRGCHLRRNLCRGQGQTAQLLAKSLRLGNLPGSCCLKDYRDALLRILCRIRPIFGPDVAIAGTHCSDGIRQILQPRRAQASEIGYEGNHASPATRITVRLPSKIERRSVNRPRAPGFHVRQLYRKSKQANFTLKSTLRLRYLPEQGLRRYLVLKHYLVIWITVY